MKVIQSALALEVGQRIKQPAAVGFRLGRVTSWRTGADIRKDIDEGIHMRALGIKIRLNIDDEPIQAHRLMWVDNVLFACIPQDMVAIYIAPRL